MAQDTIPLAATRIVAAKTIYDPQAMCGTNSNTSMRKESSDKIKVRMLKMKIPRRYRGECEGAWKCADAARMSMTKVKRAAMGCTIRMAESVVLVALGRSKVAVSESVNSPSTVHQYVYKQRSSHIPDNSSLKTKIPRIYIPVL